MNTILAPTDFTAASRTSSDYAAMLAKSFSARLMLVHAYFEPLVIGEVIPDLLETGQGLYDQKKDAVMTEARYLSKKYGVHAIGKVKMGYPSQVIYEITTKEATDVIVMGMKRFPDENKILGSTVLATLRKTNVPVLIIPEGLQFTPPAHITLATDYRFDAGTSCLLFLEEIVRKFSSTVNVLNIRNRKLQPAPLELSGKLGINNMLYDCKLAYHELPDPHVEHGIVNFINSCHTDLLVAIGHHHTMLERIFVHQFIPALTYQAPVPLLVLKEARV